jgi:Methyltransferase domain
MLKEVLRDVLGRGGRVPVIRELLTALNGARHRDHPYMRQHPFDCVYGTTTSGLVPSWLLQSGSAADEHAHAYAACQPSCLREALASLVDPQNFIFVDLGCGKGRALVLATEFPFYRILGIELAASLAASARRNARIIKKKYPDRRVIEVIEGDATSVPLPQGNLAIFLYHSFGPELVKRMVNRIIDLTAGTERQVFFIYENPVYGQMFDDKKEFGRWFCATVHCTAEEQGFAPDDDDTVVVWRIGRISTVMPAMKATAPIIITKPGWKAALAIS